jgi:arylsulfatase A-like enzyme
MQNTFEDCLTRVPLLIKPPAWVPVKPRISEALVELIDFPATVEALTGIKPLKERMLAFYMETSDVVPHDGDRRW